MIHDGFFPPLHSVLRVLRNAESPFRALARWRRGSRILFVVPYLESCCIIAQTSERIRGRLILHRHPLPVRELLAVRPGRRCVPLPEEPRPPKGLRLVRDRLVVDVQHAGVEPFADGHGAIDEAKLRRPRGRSSSGWPARPLRRRWRRCVTSTPGRTSPRRRRACRASRSTAPSAGRRARRSCRRPRAGRRPRRCRDDAVHALAAACALMIGPSATCPLAGSPTGRCLAFSASSVVR